MDCVPSLSPSSSGQGVVSERPLSPPLTSTHLPAASQGSQDTPAGAAANERSSEPAAILQPPKAQQASAAPATLPPPPAPLAPLPPPELQEHLQRLQQSHDDMRTALASLSEQPRSTAAPPPSGASKVSGTGEGDSAELSPLPSGGAQGARPQGFSDRRNPGGAITDTAAEAQWHDVTADGGVRRRVVMAGIGETPPLHAVCMGAVPLQFCACLTCRPYVRVATLLAVGRHQVQRVCTAAKVVRGKARRTFCSRNIDFTSCAVHMRGRIKGGEEIANTEKEGQGEPRPVVAGRGVHFPIRRHVRDCFATLIIKVSQHRPRCCTADNAVKVYGDSGCARPFVSEQNRARALAACTHRLPGINHALLRMRAGETCELQLAPAYGYGDKGSFSFPSVPPKATLEYTVTLLGFSPAEDKEVGQMLFEERLDAAQRARLKVRS